ncbi:hypothetical protein Cgig2_031847 [Carnegiea gigantea]|uniref:DUF2828 domain-containing protein n=1 Tax=Carnegiea gigantea TaxID=171969 RepID=A0A9Q1QMH3_9CARY|nr:hypothetical protein Cgig2_031847 [Carnegiea gigantea]
MPVSDLFPELLRSDLESLRCGDVEARSFAAKDCPSNYSVCVRHSLICDSIAKKVFPRESILEYFDIEDVHYVYRVGNRLRKDVLCPLRIILEKKQRKTKVEVMELEWRNMVQAIAENAKLSNYVSDCDVSACMKESTGNVSILMGLLISELSSSPWKQAVYGFHVSPKL